MANPGKRVDVQNLLSLGDDLVGILKNRKDGDVLVQSLEGAKMLHSSCHSDANEIQKLFEDYEKKIQASKEKIEKLKDETTFDTEVEHLQQELEGKMQEEDLLRKELRAISDELIGLERRRVSIEERREVIKRRENVLGRAQDLLSMCASVTNIIPDLEDKTKISGYVVERNKKKVEKFEFQRTESPLHICNKLWRMA